MIKGIWLSLDDVNSICVSTDELFLYPWDAFVDDIYDGMSPEVATLWAMKLRRLARTLEWHADAS